jgi:hypothetical protein
MEGASESGRFPIQTLNEAVEEVCMRKIAKRSGIVGLAVVLSATIAYGVQLKLSLQEIAQTADLIFVGTVTSQTSRYTAARTAIQTDVVFSNVEMVHGTERSRQRGGASITLSYAGGKVGDIEMHASDAPTFTTGRRYLVFASDDGKTYLNPLVGGDQGLFEVVADTATRQQYVLTAEGRAVVGVTSEGNIQAAPGRIAAIEGGRMSTVTDARPVPQSVGAPDGASPGALAETAPDLGAALAAQPPMALEAFVDHVTNVSLKQTITAPRLKREGVGVFYRAVDGEVRVEPLKTSLPPERNLDVMQQRNAAAIEQAMADMIVNAPPVPDFSGLGDIGIFGQSLFYCGNRSRPFAMEQVSTAWWEWAVNNNSMWMWNNWVDLYRYIPDDGSYGALNGENEFAGYPGGSFHGFAWGGALAMTVTWTTGGSCGNIVESDVAWNPAYSWTNDFFVGFNGTAINQLPVTGHELGHTHGLQRGGEQYNYDYVSIMHAYYSSVVEDGWGIHSSDNLNTRANYGSWTGLVDMGVESYYASNGLNNSWTNSTFFRPGNTITVNNMTVENTTPFAAPEVHLRLYLSTNQIISTGDRLLGDWWWSPSFCANCQWVGNLTTSIPSNTPPGTYWVGAIVTINGYGGDGFGYNDTTFFPTPITVSCSGTFSTSPTSNSVLRGGESSSVGIFTSGSACPWTAVSSNSTWLHITSGFSGTGNGTVFYTADANTGAARSATISAGGAFHTVSQEAGCLTTATTPLAIWGSAAGSLSTGDCLSQLRTISGMKPYADRYSFTGVAGQQIAIGLSSAAFDTYLYLVNPFGSLVASDDDGGAVGGDSRIPAVSGIYTLTASGTYVIEVTSFSVGSTGAYSVSLLSSLVLTVSPDPVTGSCKASKGKLSLGAAAPAGGLLISLSDTLAAATTPATMTIGAGNVTGTFTINTSAVASNQSGNVTASRGGADGVSASDNLTIRPISVKSLKLTPNSVTGGASSTGTVTLDCAAAPGNITVNLSSSKPATASPAVGSIVIAAGSTTGSFVVNTNPVAAVTTATIKATANGKTKSAKLTVNP